MPTRNTLISKTLLLNVVRSKKFKMRLKMTVIAKLSIKKLLVFYG